MREIMIEAVTMAWFVRLPEGRPAETRPATEAGLAELTQRCDADFHTGESIPETICPVGVR